MGSEKVVFLVIFIHPFENSGGYFFRGRLFWWILDINLQNLVRGYFSKFSLRALPFAQSLNKRFMNKPQLPNLQHTVAITILINNISNSNNLDQFCVGIFTRQGRINQFY